MDKFETAIQCYRAYMGEGAYLTLYWCAILVLVLFACKKKDLLSKKIVIYTALITFIYWCPLSSSFLLKFLTGYNVYCRMFWTLPISAVIAYVVAYAMKHTNHERRRMIVFVLAFVVLALSGKYMFTERNYVEAANMAKLPGDVPGICEIIEADAKEHKIGSMKAIVENDLVCYIRQYDGNILMNYGRYELSQGNEYVSLLNAEVFDGRDLLSLASNSQSNYLVLRNSKDLSVALENDSCRVVGSCGEYVIYYVNCENIAIE